MAYDRNSNSQILWDTSDLVVTRAEAHDSQPHGHKRIYTYGMNPEYMLEEVPALRVCFWFAVTILCCYIRELGRLPTTSAGAILLPRSFLCNNRWFTPHFVFTSVARVSKLATLAIFSRTATLSAPPPRFLSPLPDCSEFVHHIHGVVGVSSPRFEQILVTLLQLS